VSVQVPTVTLNNGVEMPILGFGVFQIPAEETEQGLAKAVGVCNFYPDRLVDLIDRTGSPRRSTRSRPTPTSSGRPTTASWSSAGSSTNPGAGSPKAAGSLGQAVVPR
jgi:2,5-diketo-D-gluconate reductase A